MLWCIYEENFKLCIVSVTSCRHKCIHIAIRSECPNLFDPSGLRVHGSGLYVLIECLFTLVFQ